MSFSDEPSPEDLTENLAALYRFALGLVRDPDLARDLVQDTVARAIERRAQFSGEGSLLAWLRQMLHNLAVDRVRHSQHEVAVEEVEAHWRSDDYTVDPAVVAERSAERAELEDALVRLPFWYRTVVWRSHPERNIPFRQPASRPTHVVLGRLFEDERLVEQRHRHPYR